MKRKKRIALFVPMVRVKRSLIFMNHICFLMFFCCLHVSANVFSQQEKVTFKAEKLSVEEVFDAITSQLKYDVFYSEDKLNMKTMVQFSGRVFSVDEVLQQVLGDDFDYRLEGKTIFITPSKSMQQQKAVSKIQVTGVVKDGRGEALPGVTVQLKGTTLGGATDMDGKFSISLPQLDNIVLVFSFVGMKTKELPYKGKPLQVVLEENAASLDEVVVTGIFERKTESFTGSTATYKSEQLKMIGGQNVLQSLRTLDPSFSIKENNQFGSDPNRLPDMEIRGKSSVVGLKEEFGNDPNQPLFILDGFEVPLQVVVDMNIDRIGAITILKDAASTAIYGSRAANGVVVIESKKPEPGKLRVRYNGDLSATLPDLTGYNLMDAREKLEFERLAGMYISSNVNHPDFQVAYDQTYNERLYNVNRGVNTYWLGEPVRLGLVHKHNFTLEGGDQNVLYSLGVSYGQTNGVMKKSDRDVLSGNFMLSYRKGKVNFSNRLTLDYTQSNNPVVPFSSYAKANPYYPKADAKGNVPAYLFNRQVGDRLEKAANPLYDASLGNMDKTDNLTFRENLQLEYAIQDNFKVSGRISISKGNEEVEKFKSPFLSEYSQTDIMKKGNYSKTSNKNFNYDGDIIIRYGHLFAEKHQVNAVGGWQFSSNQQIRDGYVAIGFPNDEVKNPAFSVQYQEDSKPSYGETKKKSTSFYGNFGYSYDRRYQVDANFRMDGASVFGTNKRFTETWSCGVSWNIHNEKFVAIPDWMNSLRVRASIGNPGNQNFGSYQSYTTYAFNTALQNHFGLGALVSAFGNPDLLWQKTLDMNFGGDVVFFNNRLRLNFNVYKKTTDPLLVKITTPSSVGMTTFTTNFGKQITKGWDLSLSFAPLYNPAERKTLTLTMTARQVRDRYAGIGNKLGGMNAANQQTSLTRFFDGGSPNDLWAVRSAGIDPSTGQEIFIKKDGSYTFEHDYDDEVIVGNSEPKVEGTVGAVLYYKGFSFSAYFRYRYNVTVQNDALYKKVENITENNWLENQDRRAYYDRWQKPGDISHFKGIGLVKEIAPISDRFIQTENSFSGESFSIGYEFTGKAWMNYLALSNLSLRANMNEIFRLSTVKAERGIDYPFARTVSFSLSASF